MALDTLDSPATDLKTAYEVLCRGCEIKERLGLTAVVCVFDQAFYAKAMEVFWKEQSKFKGTVVNMMGGFHLLLMELAIMGCRFGDAGLRDLAIQSEVVAEGSIDSVLKGKHYNRAVRLHKILHEAISRLLLDDFEVSLSENNYGMLNGQKTVLSKLKLNICQEEFERVVVSKEIGEWETQFETYVSDMRKMGRILQSSG